MTPAVSVVIPTYNGASFIRDAVLSALAQTRPPQEILLVDDGSTDETERVVASIASETHIPIRFTRLPRNTGGPSKPLNVGVASALGDFIVTLDQDDLMRPRRIELSLRALLTHPMCDLAIGHFSIIGFAERDVSPIWPTAQFADLAGHIDLTVDVCTLDSRAAFSALLIKTFSVSASNLSFTKRLWERVGGFDESIKICADLDFVLKAVMHGQMLVINETLLDYRWSQASAAHVNPSQTYLEATLARLRAAAARPDWAPEQRQVLEDAALYAAKAALAKGEMTDLLLVAKTLLKVGRVRNVLRHLAPRSRLSASTGA